LILTIKHLNQAMITAYLKVLEIISYDDALFRKEFIKTLNWVSEKDYPIIEEWMEYNQYSDRFPELLEYIKTYNT
jgi:hypothetical protein